jgi:hypothetical protein
MGSVTNLEARLKAVEDRLEAGADVLAPLYKTDERDAVVVRFPGIHRRDPFRRKEIETQPSSEVAQKRCRTGRNEEMRCEPSRF